MDSGGSMQSNEERSAEKLMDEYLKSIGLHRKKIAKDGSCLFRAVAEQVLHCQSLHTKVRAKCVEFLRKNRELYDAFIEGDFEDYLNKIQDPQQWVGEVEINALAVMYKRDFMIFQEPGKPPVNITDKNFRDKVQLCFLNGNHYDSVYSISHIKNSALCQSILYELLYDDVFKVERNLLGSCQRVARPTDLLSDDNMAACGSSDESDLDAGEALWVENEMTTATRQSRGRGRRGLQLPERVRRSLNPTLFRNVEYDVWHKTKRAQQKMDYCIAAGLQFTVGDRCQVRLDGSGRSYTATVKEVPSNGPVTVYIEELGKKQVPLWSLRPPSDESSWSTVVSRDKKLSNGHGEWEEKGRGRGRGKHIPGSSTASQAPAQGSSGRVQKQNSWPQQATVEDQGGVKTNRKSVSSVESAFGLTERQRLAKQEEERNLALVEIQLRDEHSFPALGTQPAVQSDGGRKKGGEKKRYQRNKTKSPIEDIRTPSPSDGKRPKSSTPPLADTTAATTNTATCTNSTAAAAKPRAVPSANSDSVTAATVTSSPPVACAAAASKTSAPCSPLAVAPSSPAAAAAAPSTKPAVMGGVVPPTIPSSATHFSLLTPALPAASSPATPNALSSSSPPTSTSSSLAPKSSPSPPASSVSPPTFIAPIAPSPVAAQGFIPSSSLPRCSPPVSSLPRSPTPPSLSSSAQSSPSSSQISHVAPTHETLPASAQPPNIGATPATSQTSQNQTTMSQIHPQGSMPQSQTQTQASLIRGEKHSQPSLPQNPSTMPQMQTETQPPLKQAQLPHMQHQPQSHTEEALLPQTQAPDLHLQPQNLSHSQSEVSQVQASVSAPDSVPSQPSVAHPPLPVQSAQPPHHSQAPHPSLSLSVTQTYPTLHSQTPTNQTEDPHPPTQRPPDSPAHTSYQPPHPTHPLLPSVHPLQPQPIPGVVPLQQLSQLYQDPLYPGFPLGEKGRAAPTPAYSSSKSGDDLPQDITILRFFFNLGIKAYSMPMFAPYMYLLPLQQAHTMHPKVPSRSPSPAPHYSSPNPTIRHQEMYPHPQYPPTSASMPAQYDQAPVTEPCQVSEPFNPTSYPVTEPPSHQISCPSLPWQPHQIPLPNNTSFPNVYPTPNPHYSVPQQISQGYRPGQAPGLSMYPSSVHTYPPSSLGYQSSAAHEELLVNQGAMEKCQPANSDTPGQVPAAVAANLANANKNIKVMVSGFGVKEEPGEGLTRAVLLVDPPLNNKPILIPNSGIKDVPVNVKTSGTPGSPLSYDIISKMAVTGDSNPSRGYRGHQRPNPNTTYSLLGTPEHSQVGYSSTMTESLSVGCNTMGDCEEELEYRPTAMNYRVPRRNYRGGGRWRGSHDTGRGANRRRHGGDSGVVNSYVQCNSFQRGRGR